MSEVSRRDFLRGATTGAVAIGGISVLAACGSQGAEPSEKPESKTESKPAEKSETKAAETDKKVFKQEKFPSAESSPNMNVVSDSKTQVGTTYENLLAAIQGETNAKAKYEMYAKIAKDEGFDRAARLFQCTADAEQIHIDLEFGLASKMDSSTKKPEPTLPKEESTDLNLISGVKGEIYETSDMYPSFIKKAQEEGEKEAVEIFSSAKFAEAYHAERYAGLYAGLGVNDEGVEYHLCPVCGYIHEGPTDDIELCPICKTPVSAFKAY